VNGNQQHGVCHLFDLAPAAAYRKLNDRIIGLNSQTFFKINHQQTPLFRQHCRRRSGEKELANDQRFEKVEHSASIEGRLFGTSS
jgi:hypothetical protein